MKKLTLAQALKETIQYQKMLPRDRIQYRKRQMYSIVSFAKEHSEFYREYYKDLPENFTLEDVPLVLKEQLVQNIDAWRTGIPESDCVTVLTGGTTEASLELKYEKDCLTRIGAEAIRGLLPRREHKWKFFFSRGKEADIVHLGHNQFAETFITQLNGQTSLCNKKRQIIGMEEPVSTIVLKLNTMQPSVITGTVSMLLKLAEEKKASRLKISPACIVVYGEPLTDDIRRQLENTFKADITSMYYTAEAGVIAYECREHHLHINDNHVIFEPVDHNLNIVLPGTESYSVLVTNCINRAQPVIRYRLDDKVVLHEVECLCGSKSPWIEYRGKTKSTTVFTAGGRRLEIAKDELSGILKNIDEIKRYQILVYPNNYLALRIQAKRGQDKNAVFFKAEKQLRDYMKSIGVTGGAITLEKEEPGPDEISGKFELIINKI